MNAALDQIDAFAGFQAVAVSNGTNSLTEAQCQAGLLVLTGAITAAATVVVPAALLHVVWALNLTTGGQAVTVKHSGQAGAVVPYNCLQAVWPAASAATGAGSRPNPTRTSKSIAGAANVNLTDVEAGARTLEFTGALTGNINVVLPSAQEGEWVVFNNSTGAFAATLKTPAGTGVALNAGTQGKRAIVQCDGANVVQVTAFV